jgi:hypothetical protein
LNHNNDVDADDVFNSGKIYFLLVRIKIKHMEIVIIKRESTGTGPNVYNESENIAKFEIMDGAPVRGNLYPAYHDMHMIITAMINTISLLCMRTSVL